MSKRHLATLLAQVPESDFYSADGEDLNDLVMHQVAGNGNEQAAALELASTWV